MKTESRLKAYYERQPRVELLGGSKYKIVDAMDFAHYDGKVVSKYVDIKLDTSDLGKVVFVYEKFSSLPLTAHTFFIFQFESGFQLALSIEASTEEGQGLSLARGLVTKSYPVNYYWSTARSAVGRRTAAGNSLEYYDLTLSKEESEDLLKLFLDNNNSFNSSSRAYNTLLCNCTTELLGELRRLKELPHSLRINIPAWSKGWLKDNSLI